MMVTVTGWRASNGNRYAAKTIRCADHRAAEFIKMLFDLGFDDVSVT